LAQSKEIVKHDRCITRSLGAHQCARALGANHISLVDSNHQALCSMQNSRGFFWHSDIHQIIAAASKQFNSSSRIGGE
jgi:hypothetical protein